MGLPKTLRQRISAWNRNNQQTFSFNQVVGDISVASGWQMGLGIFNGGQDLLPVPGGGICQVATTLYRAA